MIEGVGDACGPCLGDKDVVAAIMEERGGDVKTSDAVMIPRLALCRRVVYHHELSGGVDRVGREIHGRAVEPVSGGEGRVWRERAHVVKGQLGCGEKIRPTVGRKSDVCGGEDREEVVLPRPNRPLRPVGSVVEGGGYLEVDGGLTRTKERFEVSGSLVVNEQMTEGMREGGKEFRGQAISRDVGGRGARLKRDEVNVPKMVKDEKVFKAKV